MTSHCDGEVWGLDIIQIGNGDLRAITSADDNRLLTYDIKKRKTLVEGKIGEPPKAAAGKKLAARKGGASSMSSQPPNCQSRAVAYCA
jgi:hypothetical protein